MKTKTIKLSDDTYSRLNKLKLVPEEHYDSVIKRLLDLRSGRILEFRLPENYFEEDPCD